ncbi:cache domain-containing protein [Alphaproteobacteria bacterium]|nr:cache domain-containing protein [Alphaproteobacteria bacterium]
MPRPVEEKSTLFSRLVNVIRSRRLRFDILSGFALLLMITTFSVVGYLSYANNKSVIRFSGRLIDHISQSSIDKTIDFFQDVRGAVEQTSLLPRAAGDVSDSNQTLIRYMLGVLKAHPQISLFYLATADGMFLQCVQMPPGSTYRSQSKALPGTVVAAIRIISRRETPSVEEWKYVDATGRVLEEETLNMVMYNHKTRPWYIGTMQNRTLNWSDVYVFSTSGKPGLTVSQPLKDSSGNIFGVIAADISIDILTQQLKNNTIGKEGIVFIVSSTDSIIAHPDPKKAVQRDRDGLRTTVMSELRDDPIREAYQNFISTGETHGAFEQNNRSYLANFAAFPDEFGKKWYTGVVVPTKFFTRDVERNQRMSLYMSLAILLISMFFVMVFAKRVSRPIVALAEEAENIRQFKLGSDMSVKTNIRELKNLNAAIVSMRSSMRSFAKFIPKRLVEKVLSKGMEVKIGGRPREITMLFTDIAGFTSVSESYAPDKLATHLSDYFNELTQIIVDHNGTVDKYIGDAIMAFWGAPLNDRYHALNACRSALFQRKRLKELNRKWMSEGKPKLYTRFGIHTGTPIVGYMGSSERLNYTAIGDDVNLAARLEGANKFYETDILISHEVYDKVHRHVLVRPVDVVAVKGKKKSVPIYELLGFKHSIQHGDSQLLASTEHQEFCEDASKIFQLYLEQRWDEAIKQIADHTKIFGKDKAVEILLGRIQQFKKTPPPKSWDGVTVLTEK